MSVLSKPSFFLFVSSLLFCCSCSPVQMTPSNPGDSLVSGAITDKTGRPLAEVQIELTNLCWKVSEGNKVLPVIDSSVKRKVFKQTKSDANGRYQIISIKPGRYLLFASTPRTAEFHIAANLIDLAENNSQVVNFTLKKVEVLY